MAEVIDLDVLIPEPKEVKLGGEIYLLPGDIPLEVFLRINRASNLVDEADDTLTDAEKSAQQMSQMEQFSDTLRELFVGEYEPDDPRVAKFDRTISRLGVPMVVTILNTVYTDDEDEEVEADPTPAAETTGTPSTSPAPEVAPATS